MEKLLSPSVSYVLYCKSKACSQLTFISTREFSAYVHF